MKKLLVSTLLILITTMISNAAGIAQSFPTPINQRPPEIFSDSNANDPTPFPLTQKQLAWGTSQLEQLLKDRPRMAPYVQKGDDLWNWTVWQFAGEYKKDGISWNAQEPVPLWDTFFYDSSIAKDGERSSIQVTNRLAWKNYHFKQPKTGPVLWYETAFEILNLELASSIDQIDSLAREGKIDRKDYILGRMLIEWRTESSVRDFFKKIWIPACQKKYLPYEDQDLKHLFGTIVDGSGRTKVDVVRQDFVPGNFHYKFFGNNYDALSYHPKLIVLSSDELKLYVGKYKVKEITNSLGVDVGSIYVVGVENGQLISRLEDGTNRTVLLPEPDGDFYIPDSELHVSFDKDEKGNII